MYVKYCKLRRNKQLRLLEYFISGTPARFAANLVNVHHNTAIRYFFKLRKEIMKTQLKRSTSYLLEK